MCSSDLAPNSQTRGLDMKKAMEKLDLLVVIDPYPTATAVMPDRQEGVYLLPAATQFETVGSVTASNRSLQWREKVIEPLWESKPDHTIMYLFAKKFGYGDHILGATQCLHVKGIHVAHMGFQALGRLAGVADGPGAGVDFTQDVFHDGFITFQRDILLAICLAQQLIAITEFFGKQIHDGVIGLGLPQRLDDFFTPLN